MITLFNLTNGPVAIGIHKMKSPKWYKCIKPYWLNAITYEFSGGKVYKWLWFVIAFPNKYGKKIAG